MKINVENRTIFCHDNLDVLRGINSNAVDLIYLDPPFNKKKIFTAPIGSSSKGASFKDWIEEKEIKKAWLDTIKQDNLALHAFLKGIKTLDGRKSYNFCYLAYMAIRLIECKRILKESGSIYLHCDTTMCHYLKLVLDCIFGKKNFKNHVIWAYKSGGTSKFYFARKHDDILFYSKSKNYYFKSLKEKSYNRDYKPYNFKGVEEYKDFLGWYTLVNLKDVWNIDMIGRTSQERTGYPTQKPLSLLERIIKTSCPKDGVVLDPFCGCATTCVTAEKLGRTWIGIDISTKTHDLVRNRLEKQFAQGNIFEKPWNNITYLTYPLKRTDQNGDEGNKKWIYVITNPKYPGEYKVGVAKNWKARLNIYQTAFPDHEYRLEYKVETANFNKIEKTVHNFLGNQCKLKHEWVQAPLKEIKAKIKQLINN